MYKSKYFVNKTKRSKYLIKTSKNDKDADIFGNFDM